MNDSIPSHHEPGHLPGRTSPSPVWLHSRLAPGRALAIAALMLGCIDQPHTVCPETGRVCGPGYVCAPGGQACVAALSCGNGITDPDEGCDDGNRLSGDGCSSDCQSLETCGNGVRDMYEACDDGNLQDGDGCSAACVIESCGNGVVEDPYEACDDGAHDNNDGCSADCASDETCGNGYIDWWLGERCDDGNTEDGDDCPGDCRSGQCGDGVLQAGEGCDDGNTEDGDGCNADCLPGLCGNSLLEPGEQCDDGGVDTADCNADCSLARCGDGVVNPAAGEQCDDIGISPACNADCTIAECGDGVFNPAAENCDDGNTEDGDLCSADCTHPGLLVDLHIDSVHVLDLGFSPTRPSYQAEVGLMQDSVAVTATAAYADVVIEIDGVAASSGEPSQLVPLALGPNVIVVRAEDPMMGLQASYQITVDRAGAIAQATYAKASNTQQSDNFGVFVELNDSGDTLVVSAHTEDSNATGVNGNQADNSLIQSGAVYVFRRIAGMWVQEAYIKASNPGGNDVFGFGISLSASGDTLAVTAQNEDSNATGVDGDQADDSATWSGAVYVFQRTGDTWAQEAYIKASNTGMDDHFGWRAALSGSGDTLAVAARWEDSSATGVDGEQADNSAVDSGAVYVFERTGGAWAQQAYVKASNTDAGDEFGTEVVLNASGDLLIVSAGGEDSNATGVDGDQADNSVADSGAVYVFERTGDTWAQQAYVKASNTDAADAFGRSVALSASADTLAVSTGYEDSNATGVDGNQADDSAVDSGAVYVFQKSGNSWVQQAYVKASNTGAGDRFGEDVSLSASGDTLAVGAFSEDSNATGLGGDRADNSSADSGAAYLFRRSGSAWAQQSYVKASNTGPGDSFGRAVALSPSGDTLVVGANSEDSNATGMDGDQANNVALHSGAVYIFH